MVMFYMDRENEIRRIQLARAMMESTLEKISRLGVRVKYGNRCHLRASSLRYDTFGAVSGPPSRDWPLEWTEFRLALAAPIE